jgi:transcriptional regulator with XRE-family HTH domain
MGTKTDRLEQIRLELGLNKTQLAEAMGISSQQYHHILRENSRNSIRLEHLESLLSQKGINPAWVMTGQGQKYLLEESGDKPKVTVPMLKAVVSEGFPPGWDKTWLGKVIDTVCEKVISSNQNLGLVEMQNAVLKASLILSAQVEALIASSSDPGDKITLNLEGESFVFRRNKDDSK